MKRSPHEYYANWARFSQEYIEVFAVNSQEKLVQRKTLRRYKVLAYFQQFPTGIADMEDCGGAHYWAPELTKMGHDVRIMAP